MGLLSAATLLAVSQLSAEADDKAHFAGRDLQIVAHQDDDVIFINPDIQHSIDAGRVVRTVFVTAGNLAPDGTDISYWQARERGTLAAYATMARKITSQLFGDEGYADFTPFYDFSTRTVPGQCGAQPCTIDVWTLKGTAMPGQVSVTFLRLSAANGGVPMFPLEKLWQGSLPSLMTVGPVGRSYTDSTAVQNCTPPSNSTGCRTYTVQQLIALIAGIMEDFAPDRLRIQDADATGFTKIGKDHTDHLHTGRLALEAYWSYLGTRPPVSPSVLMYRGYYTDDLPQNVTGAALTAKASALDNYCVFDSETPVSCYTDPGSSPAWGLRRYALSVLPLISNTPLMNGLLLDSGAPGCLATDAHHTTVGLVDCGISDDDGVRQDGQSHLVSRGKCLTIPASSQTPGASGPVQLTACEGATSWVLLSNGVLVGSHSKVLQAASDGTLQVVDLFSYSSGSTQGGAGTLPVLDLTDLGYRWITLPHPEE